MREKKKTELTQKIDEIKDKIKEEYLDKRAPWIVPIDNSEKSGLLVACINDAILDIPKKHRKYPIFMMQMDDPDDNMDALCLFYTVLYSHIGRIPIAYLEMNKSDEDMSAIINIGKLIHVADIYEDLAKSNTFDTKPLYLLPGMSEKEIRDMFCAGWKILSKIL